MFVLQAVYRRFMGTELPSRVQAQWEKYVYIRRPRFSRANLGHEAESMHVLHTQKWTGGFWQAAILGWR